MAKDETKPQPGGGPYCTLRNGVLCSPYSWHDPVPVTLTVEQWHTVQQFLSFGKDYHNAKMWEWLSSSCKDRKMCEKYAAEHKASAEKAENLQKIIDAAINPTAPQENE